MTIKEYLNFKIVGAKEALENAKGAEEQAYTEGVLDTWNLMEDILPSLEQELTVKKLQDFCLSHSIDEHTIHCEDCPFFDAGNPEGEGESFSMPCCEIEMYAPNLWDIPSIEKTIKEATTE